MQIYDTRTRFKKPGAYTGAKIVFPLALGDEEGWKETLVALTSLFCDAGHDTSFQHITL